MGRNAAFCAPAAAHKKKCASDSVATIGWNRGTSDGLPRNPRQRRHVRQCRRNLLFQTERALQIGKVDVAEGLRRYLSDSRPTHHHDLPFRPLRAHVIDEIDPVDRQRSRKPDVTHESTDRLVLDHDLRRLDIAARNHGPSGCVQRFAEAFADGIIINDENRLRHGLLLAQAGRHALRQSLQ